MYGYELTERGKIMVAIILVLLLLLIPSAILLYTAMSNETSPPPDQGSQTSGVPPPSIFETPPNNGSESSPPPNGGGFNQPDALPSDDNVNPGGQYPTSPPGLGQPYVDPSEGTLSFFFSPGLQNTIDVETSSMLGIFLSSSKNVPGSLIAVEIPSLSDEHTEKTKSAIVSAFAALGIREQRLSFRTDQDGEATDPFRVNLSFSAQITE